MALAAEGPGRLGDDVLPLLGLALLALLALLAAGLWLRLVKSSMREPLLAL